MMLDYLHNSRFIQVQKSLMNCLIRRFALIKEYASTQRRKLAMKTKNFITNRTRSLGRRKTIRNGTRKWKLAG